MNDQYNLCKLKLSSSAPIDAHALKLFLPIEQKCHVASCFK